MEYQLVPVVGHHQQHRNRIADKGRPWGTDQRDVALRPVQDLGQVQQRNRQSQLKEIVAIPAHPGQNPFR